MRTVLADDEVPRPVVGPILVHMMDDRTFRQRLAEHPLSDDDVLEDVAEPVRPGVVGPVNDRVPTRAYQPPGSPTPPVVAGDKA